MHKCGPDCRACNIPGYESREIHFLKEYASADALFLDIGAHAGLYSLELAPLVSRVVAVEPLTMGTLVLNTAGLHNIVAVHCVGWNCSTSLGLQFRPNGQSFVNGEGSIPAAPMDIFIPPGRRLLFKIDVEGSTVEVLEGMQSLLRNVPEIAGVIEENRNHLTRFGRSPEEILELLPGFERVGSHGKNVLYKKGL